MKVVFAREAIEDLVAIGDYILLSNPSRAESFVDELQEKCIDLANTHSAFAMLAHRRDRNIRRRTYGHYLIFYSVADKHIDVLRIIHGARDYEALLFPDSPP